MVTLAAPAAGYAPLPVLSPAEEAADYCAVALRSGSPAEALRFIAQASEFLRRPELPLADADTFARRLVEAHFQQLEGRPGGLAAVALPALKSGGLGAEAFSLLLDLVQYSLVIDGALERRLTLLRRRLLLEDAARPGPDASSPLFALACALAVQAFRGGYVFAEQRDEAAAVEKLAEEVGSALDGAAPLSNFAVALLAAYRPLRSLGHADALQSAAANCAELHFRELVRVQVTEPQTEAILRGRIQALTPIADETSQSVQAQYEENPYPPWIRLPDGIPQTPPPAAQANRPKRLIAGCGTGLQAIYSGLNDSGSDYLAVDLSLTSLAYAVRKAQEYGVRNVEFRHADLLALPASGLRFDTISCVGVLHHLARPVDGLRALGQLLAGTEGLKVAVYTESARQGVVAARQIVAERDLPATTEGIRALRDIIASLPDDHPARQLQAVADYYSVSGFRDLAFHVMEHRYTIPQFAAVVEEAGMVIQRVLAPATVLQGFRARFPDPALAQDPASWGIFESENPAALGWMYRFLLAKRPA